MSRGRSRAPSWPAAKRRIRRRRLMAAVAGGGWRHPWRSRAAGQPPCASRCGHAFDADRGDERRPVRAGPCRHHQGVRGGGIMPGQRGNVDAGPRITDDRTLRGRPLRTCSGRIAAAWGRRCAGCCPGMGNNRRSTMAGGRAGKCLRTVPAWRRYIFKRLKPHDEGET